MRTAAMVLIITAACATLALSVFATMLFASAGAVVPSIIIAHLSGAALWNVLYTTVSAYLRG